MEKSFVFRGETIHSEPASGWSETHEGAQPSASEPGPNDQKLELQGPIYSLVMTGYCFQMLISKVICLILSLERTSGLWWNLTSPWVPLAVSETYWLLQPSRSYLAACAFSLWFSLSDQPARATLNYWLLTLISLSASVCVCCRLVSPRVLLSLILFYLWSLARALPIPTTLIYYHEIVFWFITPNISG